MDSQVKSEIIQVLVIILIPIIIAIVGLAIYLVYFYFKQKNKNNKEEKNKEIIDTTTIQANNKQSIFNFMEFDTVRDNMIIQKNNSRFLMVIECQGINYDLMSK